MPAGFRKIDPAKNRPSIEPDTFDQHVIAITPVMRSDG